LLVVVEPISVVVVWNFGHIRSHIGGELTAAVDNSVCCALVQTTVVHRDVSQNHPLHRSRANSQFGFHPDLAVGPDQNRLQLVPDRGIVHSQQPDYQNSDVNRIHFPYPIPVQVDVGVGRLGSEVPGDPEVVQRVQSRP